VKAALKHVFTLFQQQQYNIITNHNIIIITHTDRPRTKHSGAT